jgi:hypothetical protein
MCVDRWQHAHPRERGATDVEARAERVSSHAFVRKRDPYGEPLLTMEAEDAGRPHHAPEMAGAVLPHQPAADRVIVEVDYRLTGLAPE